MAEPVPPEQWVSVRRDGPTGIETIQAHFTGHAYDPHDHDEVLVGVTQQGVQQFHCRRRLNTSTPGRAILIEPGEVHDGQSPDAAGFTYAMLYLPQAWLQQRAEALQAATGLPTPQGFRHTLSDDPGLAQTIARAFASLHGREGPLAQDSCLDRLVLGLSGHLDPSPPTRSTPHPAAARAREVLRAQFAEPIGLDRLAALAGADRFRLHRQFQHSYGLSPHAYLVQVRLKAARQRLATGTSPAQAAAETGFADQSHLGRWFRRAYGLTPAAYRRVCGVL